ncbi:MAG: hypothetical protein PHH30_04765, partial [Bacteroidales bacterium]|nr:hypothetical protein [Bacteroidales bacterium]
MGNFKSIGYMSNQGHNPPSQPIPLTIKQRYGAGNEFWGSADHPKKIETETHSYRYYHQSNSE